MNTAWIESANEIASFAMESLWRTTWQGTIGIAIVWIICRAWKRVPSSVRSALWLLVSLKLLVAMIPASIPVACLPSTTNANTAISSSDPQRVEPDLSVPAIVPPAHVSPMVVAKASPALSLSAYVAAIWFFGVAVVTAFSIRQFVRSIRLIRRASVCEDPALLAKALELRKTMNLRPSPKILITQASSAILTLGAPRPIVMLSAKTLAECSEKEVQMVLAHEFAHVARRDTWFGLIPQLTQALFFFNPFVWIACREFDFAREAACDEAAITCLGIGSDAYGRLLLKLGTRQRTATSFCTPGVSSHYRLLRRRISMLDKPIEATPRRIHRRSIVLICLASALCIAPLSLVQAQFVTPVSLKSPVKTESKVITKKTSTFAAKAVKKATPKHAPVSAAKQVSGSQKLTLKVFHLKRAEASRAAEILRQVLGSRSNTGIAADSKTNAIVVSADDATMTQIAGVLDNLDQIDRFDAKAPEKSKEPRTVTVFPLRYAKADQLFQFLLNLYGNPSFGDIKFAQDDRTNTVVVTTPASRVGELRALVTRLDVPTPVEPSVIKVTKVFHLTNGDAKQMVFTLRGLIGDLSDDYIVGDQATNSIIVKTTEEKCSEISKTLLLLDRPKK